MTPIRALVSDFGGVLTSPLLHAFAALQEEFGIPPGALGSALAAAAQRDGAHPLYELEKGRMTEEAFLGRLEASLEDQLGRRVSLLDFNARYFAALQPNEALFAYYRTLRERGLRLLYDVPKRGTAGSRVNFVHPKDAGGVLVELVQPAAAGH